MRSLRRAILPLLWLLPAICVLAPAPVEAEMSAEERRRALLEESLKRTTPFVYFHCLHTEMPRNPSCRERAAKAEPNVRLPSCYRDDVTGKHPPNRGFDPVRRL